MLEFEDKKYVTIADVKSLFPISEKKIKKMIQDGVLSEPETIKHGTRSFRHYSAAWIKELSKLVEPRGQKEANNA